MSECSVPEGLSLALMTPEFPFRSVSVSQGVQGGRAKRYSSQRQRPVPEPPAPPVHISIVEGHYYDPREYASPSGCAPSLPCWLLEVLVTHLVAVFFPWKNFFLSLFFVCLQY